jgi:hypothetical protein
VREAEVGQPGLARSEQLAAPADVEVDLCELEAVVRAHLRKDRPLLERARVIADELVDAGGPLSDELERAFADQDLSVA